MKNTLPKANIGRFEIDGPNLKFVGFEKDYESVKLTSYKAPCLGDSGSGQWVTVNDANDLSNPAVTEDNTRRALVAMENSGYHGEYTLKGKLEVGVCGGSIPLDNGKIDIYGASCIITTHEEILGFIKKWARICKKNGEGNCNTS